MRIKHIFIFLISFLAFQEAFAQRSDQQQSMERIRAMKVGMITEKVALTESQAKDFWPIYNRYDSERRQLNQSLREKLRRTSSPGSEETEINRQDAIFKLREQELELEKQYRPQFMKVISASQYSDLLAAEKEFNQILLQELRQRGGRN
jgi:hypothetical protein